jgi:hypothetical protein
MKAKRLWIVGALSVGAWWFVHASGRVAARQAGSQPPAPDQPPRELIFEPVKLDGPVHDPAKHTFWFGPHKMLIRQVGTIRVEEN